MRSLRSEPLTERVNEWTRALSEPLGSEAVPASSLYSGDHWSVAKSISETVENQSVKVNLWICSAGYGLLKPDSIVQPYKATFTPNHPDSVASSNLFDSGDWWERMTQWAPDGYVGPRSLRALAEQLATLANSFMLVAVSETYLRAIVKDLKNAISVQGMRERIAVVSVGGKSLIRDRKSLLDVELIDALVPSDARLKRNVGGAMQTVNIRLARMAVSTREHWFPSRAALVQQFTELSKATPALEVHRRSRLSDEAINAEIGRILSAGSGATPSAALRILRDSGMACEQHRFSKLFHAHTGRRAGESRTSHTDGD